MERESVPVFMFTGFVESGKTTMIHRWLTQDFFKEQEKVVLIVCEDGFTEYEEDKLDDNIVLCMVENKDDFNKSLLSEIEKKYEPTAVIIEHNCMVSVDTVLDVDWPENWDLVEISAMIDSNAFEAQMKNMRSMMVEQFKYATVVIFNRFEESNKKLKFRAMVKAVNPEAQLMFIKKDGTADETLDELPFNVNAPVIKVEDLDYGLWYIDVFDHPEKYDGKTIQLKGIVATPAGYPKNSFLIGRPTMTCCADDIQYLKVLCITKGDAPVQDGQWMMVTAKIQICQPADMEEPSPVFHVTDIRKAVKAEPELVYFS